MNHITNNELRRLAERGEIAAMEATMSEQERCDFILEWRTFGWTVKPYRKDYDHDSEIHVREVLPVDEDPTHNGRTATEWYLEFASLLAKSDQLRSECISKTAEIERLRGDIALHQKLYRDTCEELEAALNRYRPIHGSERLPTEEDGPWVLRHDRYSCWIYTARGCVTTNCWWMPMPPPPGEVPEVPPTHADSDEVGVYPVKGSSGVVTRKIYDQCAERCEWVERERDELKAKVSELEVELEQAKTINQGYERWNKEAKRILGDARQQRIDDTAALVFGVITVERQGEAFSNWITQRWEMAYLVAELREVERERRVGDVR